MPLSALEAAKKTCQRTRWGLSNLVLQKILYLAQLRYKRDHLHQRLISASFEAWDYGPVIPEVYHQVKAFGSDPVRNVFHSVNDEPGPFDADLFVSVDLLARKSPAQLVALTHRSRGAWADFYRPDIKGIVIPDSAIDAEAGLFRTP